MHKTEDEKENNDLINTSPKLSPKEKCGIFLEDGEILLDPRKESKETIKQSLLTYSKWHKYLDKIAPNIRSSNNKIIEYTNWEQNFDSLIFKPFKILKLDDVNAYCEKPQIKMIYACKSERVLNKAFE